MILEERIGLKDILPKRLKKTDYIVIMLCGLLLLVIATPTGSKINLKNGVKDNLAATSDEIRLKNVLEKMNGVGRVEIMINKKEEQKTNLFGDEKQQVEGIVVVAEGADYPSVNKDIMEAIMALFDVEAHKIKIVKMSL